MTFGRLLSLIPALLVLAGIDRSPGRGVSYTPQSTAELLRTLDAKTAKDSLPHHAHASPPVLPVGVAETAAVAPKATCHPAAVLEEVATVIKHAYSSTVSGLSPPRRA